MRRSQSVAYSAVVVGVVGLQAATLVALATTFWLRLVGRLSYEALSEALLAAVAVSRVVLVGLTAVALVQQAWGARAEARRRARTSAWRARLPAFPVRRRLPEVALDALLEAREAGGDDAALAATALVSSGTLARLTRRSRSRFVMRRVDALDSLSRARLPEALPALLAALSDEVPLAHVLAQQAAARTLAAMPAGPARSDGVAALLTALRSSAAPGGVLAETLLLLGDAAGDALALVLRDATSPPALARAALEGVGRLGYEALAAELVVAAGFADPEHAAAALRALGRLRALPAGADAAVAAALSSDAEFVRVNAARAAARLPLERALVLLPPKLRDAAFWVRRAAAESLWRLGPEGREALARAAALDPDRFAREMAAQTLRGGAALSARGAA